MKIIRENTKSKVKVIVRRNSSGDITSAKTGYYGYGDAHLDMVPNFVWRGRLKANSFARGRSSVRFRFLDTADNEYEMSPNNHCELLNCLVAGHHKFVDEIWIEGDWTFAKEGQNVSVVPVAQETRNDEP